jgi:putative hydrolase of the HAD superfamily
MSSVIPDRIRALVFDYGNTVVPFGPPEIARCDEALAAAMERLYGPVDRARLAALRNEDRLAPYAGDPPAYRENDLAAITARAVRVLTGREPAPEDLKALILTRFNAFVESIVVPDTLPPLLDALARRYRLGLCSNYPDAGAIRASLRRTGLDRRFDPVIVSADVGRVKPHPAMFDAVRAALDLPAHEIAFIGDNWLADVQGARRAGLWTAWCVRWDAPEAMPRRPDDLQPDTVLTRLEALLEGTK